jgi:aryl-alcohol dehydrogenase-like predicted oxidoreductase
VARSYNNDENFERLSRARQLAGEKGVTAAETAIAYVLNLPAPVIAVVGALVREEVCSAFAASGIELSAADMEWLDLKTGSR